MVECLHTLVDKRLKYKLFSCENNRIKNNFCCKTCQSTTNLYVCLYSMNVYCVKDKHLMSKKHVLFYDLTNKELLCTFCERKTKISFGNKEIGGEKDNTIVINMIKIPKRGHFRVIPSNLLKGFQNLGNTCYLNALFHILFNLDQFKKAIINENHSIVNCGHCLLCNIKKIISNIDIDCEITLKEMIICIMKTNKEYKNDDQHDIHTFYLNYIEILKSNVLKKDGDCLIDEIFYGSMSSCLKCLQCGFKRQTVESFCSISLNHTKTLQESFEDYFEDERMEDKLFCLNCKTDTFFSKSLKILQSPTILAIQVMRFTYNNSISKINDKIEILEHIVINDSTYKLKGFVQHKGSCEQGHFISYSKNGGDWYEFDDNNVRKVVYKNVPLRDSYLLFYVKRRQNKKHNELLREQF